jgi:hypothetical protein
MMVFVVNVPFNPDSHRDVMTTALYALFEFLDPLF